MHILIQACLCHKYVQQHQKADCKHMITVNSAVVADFLQYLQICTWIAIDHWNQKSFLLILA